MPLFQEINVLRMTWNSTEKYILAEGLYRMGYARILICPLRLLRTSLVRSKSLPSERKIALLMQLHTSMYPFQTFS
jgi:hypothetical protein